MFVSQTRRYMYCYHQSLRTDKVIVHHWSRDDAETVLPSPRWCISCTVPKRLQRPPSDDNYSRLTASDLSASLCHLWQHTDKHSQTVLSSPLSLSLSLYQWLTQTSLKRNDRTHHALHAVRRTISAPLECLSSRYYHFPDLIMRSFLSVRLLIRSFVMRGIITQNVLDGFGSGGFDRLTQYSYGLHVSQKMHQLWNGVAQNYCRDRFWWYLAEIFKSL